jgi:hypothetical protein
MKDAVLQYAIRTLGIISPAARHEGIARVLTRRTLGAIKVVTSQISTFMNSWFVDRLEGGKAAFNQLLSKGSALSGEFYVNEKVENDLARILERSTVRVTVFNKSIFVEQPVEQWPESVRRWWESALPEDRAAFISHMGLEEMGLENLVMLEMIGGDGEPLGDMEAMRAFDLLMQRVGAETVYPAGGPKGQTAGNHDYALLVPGTADSSPFGPLAEAQLASLPTSVREALIQREAELWQPYNGRRRLSNIVYPSATREQVENAAIFGVHFTLAWGRESGVVGVSPHIDLRRGDTVANTTERSVYHSTLKEQNVGGMSEIKRVNTGNGMGLPLFLLMMTRALTHEVVRGVEIEYHNGARQGDPSLALSEAAIAAGFAHLGL